MEEGEKTVNHVLLALIACSYLNAIQTMDLGTVGTSYEIQEIDLLKQMKTGIKDINASLQMKSFFQSVQSAKTRSSNLPDCRVNKSYEIKNEVKAQASILNLDGTYRIKQGDPISINNRIAQSLCIADASSPKRALLSANALLKDHCDKIMVSGMDFELFQQKYVPDGNVYPFHQQLAQVLHAQCLPSRITAEGEHLQIEEFSIAKDEK